MKQRIIFATGNKNKMREIHEILGDLGWEILAECFEPNETGLKTSLLQERWPNKEALH